jgi:prepilin-type N-terminal cleavage/methylation domain-containing protein
MVRGAEMKRQAGFTLVELTIATAVTLVVLAAAISTFRDATLANNSVTLSSDMNDNLRAGMNLIVQDLIQTGTGIPAGGISIPNTTDVNGCNVGKPVNRPPASLGLKFNGPNAITPGCYVVLPAIEPGPDLGPAVVSPDGASAPASDVISLLYADNTLALDQAPIIRTASVAPPVKACNGTIAKDGSTVTFDPVCVTIGAAGIPVNTGDLIMFSNNNGTALQTVTSVNGQTLNFAAGDAFNLNGRTASETGGTILHLQNFTVDAFGNVTFLGTYPPTTATRIRMITYYLDPNTDPQHPRLMRAVNFSNPVDQQAVAETLENLQFTYNLEDGTVPPPVAKPGVPGTDTESQIRSVSVYLGARSTARAARGQQYIRTNLATQVTLRSLAYFNTYK